MNRILYYSALIPPNFYKFNQRLFHFTVNATGKIIPYKLADIGEGIADVQLKEWYVKVGDKVNEFDEICVVQSDKASVTISSRYQGVVRKLYHEIDGIAYVGKPLVDIEVEEDDSEKASSKNDTEKQEDSETPNSEVKETAKNCAAKEFPSTPGNNKILAAPAVRRIIREHNVDTSQLKGTGKDGRLLKEDLLNYLGNLEGSPSTDSLKYSQEETLRDAKKSSGAVGPPLTDQIVPIRGYTRAMIKTMTEALKIPHFGYNDEYCVDNLINARNELQKVAIAKGINFKLSYMPLIIKATSLSLSQFPSLNSSIDSNFENLIYKASHNISLAMDTPQGLVVPNIKNCQQKSIWEIANQLNHLLELGKNQKFSKEDLMDGTFTLSNIGAIGGGTYMKPVIFPPQVAIGALGRIQKLPRFDANGQIQAQNILNVSWSADHRVVDGATMARFSNQLKMYLENPNLMLAELK